MLCGLLYSEQPALSFGYNLFLKNTPAENGASAHFISVNFRKAKGLAPTLDMLKIEAGKQDFDHLDTIYAAMKKDTPDFKPSANQMGSWADDLIAAVAEKLK